MLHRRFWNAIEANYWDWPNFQRAYPWRIWFDEKELADVTVNPPVVTTGADTIPSSAIFWGPWNYSPPYTYLELDRSKSFAFGVGDTPQRDVSITGNYGYWTKTAPAGTLAAALTDTTSTTATVSNAAAVGVGDVLIIASESLLVQDRAMADTGQSQQGPGAGTEKASDNQLTVGDGTKFSQQETVQLDGEQMLILSVTGNVLTVKRAFNGTILGAHSGAEVYAPRLLTVARGFGGTTAATHSLSAALSIQLIPGLVKELSLAEAVNHVLQETSGYARTMPPGSGGVIPGGGLPDLRDRCQTEFGRIARQRVV